MTSTIKIKNSSTAGAVPGSGDLVQGELAVNVTDKKIYTKNASGTVVNLGTTPSITDNGNATAITIDSSENVGVGVSPSAWGTGKAFEVGYAGNAVWTLSSGDVRLMANAYYNGTNYIYSSTNYASYYRQDSGRHIWLNAASGTQDGTISFTQAMTLDASGNLLVNSTGGSGNGKLHVKAADGTSGNEYRGLTVASTTTETKSVNIAYDSANDVGVIAASQSGTAWKNLALCPAGGNLLVGTTSPTVGTGKIYVQSSGGSALITHTDNTNINCINTSGSGSTLIYFQTASVELGSIRQSGSSAVVYNTTSDYRLKEITSGLTGYKERLLALQPKQGSWKVDGSEFRGFLAHEFAESYPASVSGEKDEVDAEGKPKYQGMQAGSSEVVADLVAMIQEQQAIITQLQADVAALKG